MNIQHGVMLSGGILAAMIIFMSINIFKYNWKNGELKVRIAIMLFLILMARHLYSVHDGFVHGWYLSASLASFGWIMLRHYIKKPLK